MDEQLSKAQRKRRSSIREEYVRSWLELHGICEAEGFGAECTREEIRGAIASAAADGVRPVPHKEQGTDVIRNVALQVASHLPSPLKDFFLRADDDVLSAVHRRFCAEMAMKSNRLEEFDADAPASRRFSGYKSDVVAARYKKIAGNYAEQLSKIEATIGIAGITASELIELIETTRNEREQISRDLEKLEQELRRRQAASGGIAKSAALEEVREFCRMLYKQQPESKKHQTRLKAIRDRVIAYAKDRGHVLSYDQFIKTASRWVSDLREAPAE